MFRLGITHKLGLALCGFALLFFLSAIDWRGFLNKYQSNLTQAVTVAGPMKNAAYEMEINTLKVGLRVVKYLHRPEAGQRRLIASDIAGFEKFHAIYTGLAFTGQQRALAANAEQMFAGYIDLANTLLGQADALAGSANPAIEDNFRRFEMIRRQIERVLDEEIRLNAAAYLKAIGKDQQATLAAANQLLLLRAALWAIITILTLIFVSRSVVFPLRKLSQAAGKLGAGDFNQRVEWRANDEIGYSARIFNMMAERLQEAHGALSRANTELDARVADRTDELASANERLNSAIKRLNSALALRKRTEKKLRDALAAAHSANAASHAKTLFLGNMSHELRTPLNAIIGFSEMIAQRMFGPPGHEKYTEYANYINQSGMHLLRMVNELLDVSCIESVKLSLSEETFNLAGVLEASLHVLAAAAERRGVILAHDIAGDLPLLHGDPTRVQQIFNNLLGNAIKFSPAGGSVRLSAWALPDGSTQITVADTGIGIAPEDLPKVLETFGQVANELTRAHEGAGLGLPLAKMLTERHGGALEIISEVGCGTKITVSFPASRTVQQMQIDSIRG